LLLGVELLLLSRGLLVVALRLRFLGCSDSLVPEDRLWLERVDEDRLLLEPLLLELGAVVRALLELVDEDRLLLEPLLLERLLLEFGVAERVRLVPVVDVPLP